MGRLLYGASSYVRHGVLCFMGAYDVRRGTLFGFTADKRGGEVFVELLDAVDACYPEGKGHLVMDNLSDHDTDDVNDWLEEHPRWTRHFTPKHASWLNQIENAFSTFGRRVLSRSSFCSRMISGTRPTPIPTGATNRAALQVVLPSKVWTPNPALTS